VAELSALAQLSAQHRDEPLVSLLIRAAVLHTEANLKIVERAERDAARLAQRRAEPAAARTQTARRRAAG
jgi:hypothetical protein